MSIFTLYRFYDADDRLLYVGLTVNPGRRMEKHRSTKSWWADVARIAMEQHADLETLRAAERVAINAEKPLYNIRMNGGGAMRSVAITSRDPMRESFIEPDSLVGRFFHTWTVAAEDDSMYRIGERRPHHQGQITSQIDGGYLARLFSWWDGVPNEGEQIVDPFDGDWTFYSTAEDMVIALGCREPFERGEGMCRNPVTHRVRFGGEFYIYKCWRCIKHYSGAGQAEEL